jgi:hypothetical protein
VSWDVPLLRFEHGDEAPVDRLAIRRTLASFPGVRDHDGEAQLEGDGIADVLYGSGEPDSDVLVTVNAGSPTVTRLIFELARAAGLVVFLPGDPWRPVAVLPELARQLPAAGWHGWEQFDDGYVPPEAIVCVSLPEFADAVDESYRVWDAWVRAADWQRTEPVEPHDAPRRGFLSRLLRTR